MRDKTTAKEHWIGIGKRSHKIVWNNRFFFLLSLCYSKAAAMAATTTTKFLRFKSMFNVCTKYPPRSLPISVAILLLYYYRFETMVKQWLGSAIYFGWSIEITKRRNKIEKMFGRKLFGKWLIKRAQKTTITQIWKTNCLVHCTAIEPSNHWLVDFMK